MVTNIVKATFGTSRSVRTRPLYQWDYGQVLQFELDLPVAYEVHFSNEAIGGNSVTQIGDEDGVAIPDALLTTGRAVYAWVYLHVGEDDGETIYSVIIPVACRPKPTNDTPTPVQQDAITQAIAALNSAVAKTAQDVVDADAARAGAEAAQGFAEAAQHQAEVAQGVAENAAGLAQGYAQQADTSAANAARDAATAEAARDTAQGYASDAADSADHAEQAASIAGYMRFYIDERGHLMYHRVGFHDTSFALVDGHLILGVS